jgi:hypothetical protein
VATAPPEVRRRILIVPGIFGECVQRIATPFQDGAVHLRGQGYRVDLVSVSGRSGSEANAAAISDWLRRFAEPAEPLLMIGYSKGTSDILEAVGRYPDAIPAGTAIVSVGGVVSGTPMADSWERMYRRLAWMPVPGCRPGDGGGVTSLTHRERQAWLEAHPLPHNRHYFSLPAFTSGDNISRAMKQSHRWLSTIDPRNDGQVIWRDAIIPGGTLLGYANCDHWALALPLARNSRFAGFFANRNGYPREILLEAVVRMVEEQLATSVG